MQFCTNWGQLGCFCVRVKTRIWHWMFQPLLGQFGPWVFEQDLTFYEIVWLPKMWCDRGDRPRFLLPFWLRRNRQFDLDCLQLRNWVEAMRGRGTCSISFGSFLASKVNYNAACSSNHLSENEGQSVRKLLNQNRTELTYRSTPNIHFACGKS